MNVIQLRGELAPKNNRSSMETMLLNIEQINQWKTPPFQRPIRVNEKVKKIAAEIGTGGLISGVITLGNISGSALYVVDGLHRLEAFRLSGRMECIADVRLCHYESMAKMAEDFVELNGAIVKMRPDDILRGLETVLPQLRNITRDCSFVGYDSVRRNDKSPIVGMSTVLRVWVGSRPEAPTSSTRGAALLAEELDAGETELMIRFLTTAFSAWGREQATYRLWGVINLCLCMWCFRRLVVDRDRTGTKRYTVLTFDLFKKCLMSLAADANYVDWLQGRNSMDRDRAAAYGRMKAIFSKRLADETGKKQKLPQPPWDV